MPPEAAQVALNALLRRDQLEPEARSVLELTALAGGRLLQQTAAQAAALDGASFGKQVGLSLFPTPVQGFPSMTFSPTGQISGQTSFSQEPVV